MISAGEHTLEVMSGAKWYNNWLFGYIKPHIKKEILEIGSGIGNFTELLKPRGTVTATDYEKRYLKILKEKLGNDVNVGYADIEKGKYFFKDKKFDSIICLNVLEHIENDELALRNMHNILKKGGKLVILVPAHKLLLSKFDRNIGHFRRYTTKSLSKKLKNAGFRETEERYLNWFAAIGWLVFLKLLKNEKLPANAVKIFDFLGRLSLIPEKAVKFPFGLSVFATATK